MREILRFWYALCIYNAYPRGMQAHHNSTNVTKTQLVSRLAILEEVSDSRVTATVDHDLPDLLAIALGTILRGGDSFLRQGGVRRSPAEHAQTGLVPKRRKRREDS